jgi:hypothetical protein
MMSGGGSFGFESQPATAATIAATMNVHGRMLSS